MKKIIITMKNHFQKDFTHLVHSQQTIVPPLLAISPFSIILPHSKRR